MGLARISVGLPSPTTDAPVFKALLYEVRFLFGRSTALRNDSRFMAFWKHVIQLPNSIMQILKYQNVHLKYNYTNFWICKIHVNRINN